MHPGRIYLDIHDRLNLPILETGAVLVAWTEREAERLPGILETAHRNGVTNLGPLTVEELYAREPSLAPGTRAALRIPGEHVIDPWSAPLAYLSQAVANGAEALFDSEVLEADRGPDGWVLATSRGLVRARAVVNCAGLHGDLVDALAGLRDFEIRPRKGIRALRRGGAPGSRVEAMMADMGRDARAPSRASATNASSRRWRMPRRGRCT